VYGDLCSGTLWRGRQNANAWAAASFTATAGSLFTFGEDLDGELYLARGNGQLLRLVAAP
jgi:hypothetical protein